LHPAVAPLAFLLGTWRGEGRRDYPTIEPFAYQEETVFAHVGKPFFSYAQRTRAVPDEAPLHGETGYLRPTSGGALELVIAHPTGILELDLGHVDGTTLALRSDRVLCTPTAKEVVELRYVLDMAAVGQPLTFHLEATLRRVRA